MKKTKVAYPVSGLILLLFFWACQKSAVVDQDTLLPPGGHHISPDTTHQTTQNDTVVVTPTLPVAPYPQAPLNGCSFAPIYGDSMINQQATNGDDIFNVVNSPGTGKYLSWPAGMSIDSMTGAIDISRSETGMKYVIGFVKAGTTDTCLSTLIIGGASYMDSVYVIADGQTTAVPYFDANPNLLNVCGTGGSCSFDIKGTAAKQGVIVNEKTGDIDLKKTLNGTGLLGGAFGLLPVNGQTITTTIFYNLGSQGGPPVTQQISVQFEYFSSKNAINLALLNNVINKLDNLLSGHVISESANPRPPLIIIVRNN